MLWLYVFLNRNREIEKRGRYRTAHFPWPLNFAVGRDFSFEPLETGTDKFPSHLLVVSYREVWPRWMKTWCFKGFSWIFLRSSCTGEGGKELFSKTKTKTIGFLRGKRRVEKIKVGKEAKVTKNDDRTQLKGSEIDGKVNWRSLGTNRQLLRQCVRVSSFSVLFFSSLGCLSSLNAVGAWLCAICAVRRRPFPL